MSQARVDVRIKVRIGEQTITVDTGSPLALSGDRRRWRKQLREHLDARLDMITAQLTVPPGDAG